MTGHKEGKKANTKVEQIQNYQNSQYQGDSAGAYMPNSPVTGSLSQV